MVFDPGMAEAHMVRHEIEHQSEATLFQSRSQTSECCIAPQRFMHGIASNGEAGAGDVVVGQIGERFVEFAKPFRVGARDLLRTASGLPDAQEPNPIEAYL